MNKIKIGIVGYGNIGRGVEQSIKRNDDMELAAVFTRRDPATVSIQTESAAVKHFDEMASMKDEIDVMILCGGSATDLIEQTPMVTKYFNCIDSFDTHARIPEHFANVDKVAKEEKSLTMRYSPGYGDLDISANRDILNVLDAHRKIGVTVTNTGIMIPRKSVVALIGITNEKIEKVKRTCENCSNRFNCEYRRKADGCGGKTIYTR